MAQVSVDISEFDALRQAKEKAESENARLIKEINDAKSDLRTVVITKTVSPSEQTVERMVREAFLLAVGRYLTNSGWNDGGLWWSNPKSRSLENKAVRAVANAIDSSWDLSELFASTCRKFSGAVGVGNIISVSQQFINFEDVRSEAKTAFDNEFRDGWEKKMKDVERMKVELERARAEASASLREEFDRAHESLKDQLETEYKKKVEQLEAEHKRKVEQMESDIRLYKDSCEGLQKEKIEAAERKEREKYIFRINALETELKALRSRGLFARIFNA